MQMACPLGPPPPPRIRTYNPARKCAILNPFCKKRKRKENCAKSLEISAVSVPFIRSCNLFALAFFSFILVPFLPITLNRIYTIIQVKINFVKSFFYFFTLSKNNKVNPLKVLANKGQCKFQHVSKYFFFKLENTKIYIVQNSLITSKT